jgi:hypothetical protein
MRRLLFGVLLLACTFLVPTPASAQTPDASTPAQEEACTKYEGEGARQGLCIAYCEAQDCDNTKDSNPSCGTIAERFIAYSVKQGYAKGVKDKPVISCQVTACTDNDALYCGGREQDCDLNGDGVCEQICTAKFEGFIAENKPLCSVAMECKKCVGGDPKK